MLKVKQSGTGCSRTMFVKDKKKQAMYKMLEKQSHNFMRIRTKTEEVNTNV